MKKSICRIATVPIMVVCTLVACTKPVAPPAEKKAEAGAQPQIYQLVPDAGTIAVTVIKNGDVEVHASFNSRSGVLRRTGRTWEGFVTAHAASFESGVTERNTNVRTTFFGLSEAIPNVPATLMIRGIELPQEFPETLTTFARTVSATVQMFDQRLTIGVPLQGEMTSGGLHVSTVNPVAIRFAQLGLAERLQELIQVCGHKSVSPQFMLEFDGVFRLQK